MECSGIHCQAKALKVFIKCKTRDIIKHMCDNYKRNGIAIRKPYITGEFSEYFFGSHSYGIFILNNIKSGFYFIQKPDGKSVISPISEKSNCFADNIPCGVKGNRVFHAIFKRFTSFFKIGVIGV